MRRPDLETGGDLFDELVGEQKLIDRLREHRVLSPDLDLSIPNQRREAIRGAILTNALSSVLFGARAGGKVETYAQAFARVYGQPL